MNFNNEYSNSILSQEQDDCNQSAPPLGNKIETPQIKNVEAEFERISSHLSFTDSDRASSDALSGNPESESNFWENLTDPSSDNMGIERFKLLSCAEFLKDKNPPETLIPHLLLQEGLFWFYGLWGCLKTFLMIHIAVLVASGQPFFGRKTRQRTVVYLAGEGHRGLRIRLQAALSDLGFDHLPIMISDKGGRLDPDGMAHVISVLDELKETGLVIIFDTQATWAVGDENSNTDSNEYVDFVKHLSGRYHACVLTVHHTTKDGNRMRGAGNFEGSADGVFCIKKETKNGKINVSMKTTKLRDFRDDQNFRFVAQEVPLDESWRDEDGGRVTSLVLSPDSTEDAVRADSKETQTILTLVKENPEASQKKLKELIQGELEIGLNQAGQLLKQLVEEGQLVSTQEKRGTSIRYSVPAEGLNAQVAKFNARS